MPEDPGGIESLCPACGAPLQLVWVHGHGQCANCMTAVVSCCMGAGQEADEHGAGPAHVTVDDVVRAFERCRDGARAITLTSLVHAITQREECTEDAAMAAIERAATLKRLALAGGVVRSLA